MWLLMQLGSVAFLVFVLKGRGLHRALLSYQNSLAEWWGVKQTTLGPLRVQTAR